MRNFLIYIIFIALLCQLNEGDYVGEGV